MKIFIDKENKCHVTNDGTMSETLAPAILNGKCPAFIEGYKFIPKGTREIDGVVYGTGEVYPWRDYELLAEFQVIYEEEQAKATAEIAALVEDVYNSDMEVIENV